MTSPVLNHKCNDFFKVPLKHKQKQRNSYCISINILKMGKFFDDDDSDDDINKFILCQNY